MSRFLFKERDGQTPLPAELYKGLKIKNIQTLGELDEYEERNIANGLIWLESTGTNVLNYSFWIKLHKKLFADVWSWAGEIRRHELQNPDFLAPQKIRTEMMKLIGDVEYWLENQTYPSFEMIARVHERLLTIHPFANGNGRWARILTEAICQQYNIQNPTWNLKFKDEAQKRRRDYIEAIEEARQRKNYLRLAEVIFS